MSDDFGSGEREQSTIQFPYSDMEEATRVAAVLTRAALDRDQLASALGQVPKSGAFGAKVAAARMFGLIESIAGRYKLTELGYEILDPQRAPAARASAFLMVPLYAKLFEDFKGRQLPPKGPALENALVGLGVAVKQKDRARRIFEASARFAGFFNPTEDRLVRPVVPEEAASAVKSEVEAPARVAPEKPATIAPPRLHPAIQGLLETLPDQSKSWSAQRRKKWLLAAENILDLIYEVTPLPSETVEAPEDGDV